MPLLIIRRTQVRLGRCGFCSQRQGCGKLLIDALDSISQPDYDSDMEGNVSDHSSPHNAYNLTGLKHSRDFR